MIDKLTENLFHIDLALGDAEVELEDIEGAEAAIESLKIARQYVAEIKKDIVCKNNEEEFRKCKNCKYRMPSDYGDPGVTGDPSNKVWCTHHMHTYGRSLRDLRRANQKGCRYFEQGDATNREEWFNEDHKTDSTGTVAQR